MNAKPVIKAAILVGACSALGCKTVPDSSLIYGSKLIVGIGLETDTSGAQFPEFNMGVNTKDFAKVPVAVHIDGEHEMHLIWGSYCGGSAQDQSACATLFGEKEVLTVSADELTGDTRASRSQVDTAIGKVARELSLRPLSGRDGKLLFAMAEPEAAEKFRERLKEELQVATPAEADSENKVRESVDKNVKAVSASDIVRKDAYSVFGSFDADAEKTSAKIGKVFATGVAAQTVADSVAAASRARCVEAMKGVASVTPDQILQACK